MSQHPSVDGPFPDNIEVRENDDRFVIEYDSLTDEQKEHLPLTVQEVAMALRVNWKEIIVTRSIDVPLRLEDPEGSIVCKGHADPQNDPERHMPPLLLRPADDGRRALLLPPGWSEESSEWIKTDFMIDCTELDPAEGAGKELQSDDWIDWDRL